MIKANNVGITTPQQMQEILKFQFENLYKKGWDVIASVGKSPYLHPYKDIDRAQLLAWGLENIQNYKANSITLRLENTDIIALDFDIYDVDLFNKIYKVFEGYFDNLQTCRGKKGCKIFLNCPFKKKLYNTFSIPSTFNDGTLNSDNKIHKQNIEIKKGLSTVYGVYPTDSDVYLYDCMPNSEYVVNSSVYDINEITEKQFNEIEKVVTEIIKKQYQIKETQSRDIELLRASYCVYKTLPYCFTVQFFRLLCKFGKTDIALAFDEPSKIAPIEIWHAQASEVEKMKYIKLFNLYFDDKKYNLINDLILNDVDIEMLRNKNFLEIFNIFNSEMLTK